MTTLYEKMNKGLPKTEETTHPDYRIEAQTLRAPWLGGILLIPPCTPNNTRLRDTPFAHARIQYICFLFRLHTKGDLKRVFLALRDNRIQLHKSTPTELSITISNVQLSDDGEYTCSIFTMPVRIARATVTVLGVPGKPVITGFEDPVQEGGAVTLTCTSTGSKPPALLYWYKGQEKLEARPNVVESNPNEPTYTVTSVLTLRVTRNDNNAMIGCAVDHPSITNGEKRTEKPLSVLFSPSVLIKPESDLPREGERFSLHCVGIGNPE
ncbi:cell adhesion molecule 3 isoform X1 [Tachysurus ichikawai]